MSSPLPSASSIACDSIPPQAELVGFRGREALSTPYRFEIGFSLPHSVELDMHDVLGERAALYLEGGSGKHLVYHGIVAGLELVDEHLTRSLFVMTLVPELWHLSLSHHSRIFTDASIPEIIEAVLKHSGLSTSRFAFQLVDRYPKLEHVCQYRESNLAFISRLMEREGIYYYFEQGDQSEALIITDDRSSHSALGSGLVPFGNWQEGSDARGTLEGYRCRMAVLPAAVELSDYDYLKPELAVRGRAAVTPRGRGEVVVYGENFRTPEEGQRLARIRSEELATRQAIFDGRGSHWGLRPGYLFTLEQHPRPSFNRSYLATRVEHWGKQVKDIEAIDRRLGLDSDRAYEVEVEAIASDVPFRAERVTPWPRIDGVVDGVVDGSGDSPYAQIDEHGRYKVRVFFDESDLVDGSASTWVRMLQPHGGGTEGMHFPLRKGTEVHMVFLGGDPDRPVIVGVAPNALKPSKVTSANFTKNVVMTGGSNRLELEDAAGSQYVTMSTPTHQSYLHMGSGAYNFVAHTLGHAHEMVGGNRDGQVVGNLSQQVNGSVTQTYQSTMDTTVSGAVTEAYDASHSRTVAGPVTFQLNSTLTEQIAGPVVRNIDGTVSENVGGAVTLHYMSTLDHTIDGDVTLTTANVTEVHNGDKSTTITGSHGIDAAGAQQISSYTSQQITAPTQEISADGVQLMKADTHTVEASSAASVTAPTVTIHGDGSVTISGASITIEGGDVTMTGGTLSVDHGAVSMTAGSMTVDGGGAIDMVAGLIKLNS